MFRWDENKRALNLSKHGIGFRDATQIFDGPFVTVEDTRGDYGERRYAALGMLERVVASVAYTERGENVRLISMRKALKHETQFYLSQIGK